MLNVIWVKCNIGVSWNKNFNAVGGAWVLRDYDAKVLLHSRRSFSSVDERVEANLMVLMWAIESILDHGFSRVIFELEDASLVGATTRPDAWPSLGFESNLVLDTIHRFSAWKIEMVQRSANSGAFFIAQSVTCDRQTQSYVAMGFPEWLREVFQTDEICSSVSANV